MVLEPGDRIRVVAPRRRMADVTRFFGDSYRNLSEIDVSAFRLGLIAGLLLGLVPVPLPGGGTFRLGMAGGPLVVGLILGALERTGPITWQLPYNANLTLRQFGAVPGRGRGPLGLRVGRHAARRRRPAEHGVTPSVYPVATIIKIVLAQVILVL